MSTKAKTDPLDKLLDVMGKMVTTLGHICFFGLRRVNLKDFVLWLKFGTAVSCLMILTLGPENHLNQTLRFLDFDGTNSVISLVLKIPAGIQFGLLIVITLVLSLVVLGLSAFMEHGKLQKALNKVGLKSALGKEPEIKRITKTGDLRKKITVETHGIGLGLFEAKRDSLQAAFRMRVESIESANDLGQVEIYLCAKELPKMVQYADLYTHVKDPYSIIVGQSSKGPVIQSLLSLPHMLISGATGGGKSVFFRSSMLSLLKSSPHIQLYLLDMKRGVEVKEFSELPNVKTAKNKTEAISMLDTLLKEMHRRYDILENAGEKLVDPVRDNLDIIVIGIDEAAVLFSKSSDVEGAREKISELARLGRAAGFHIIPATQKPIKDAIDTDTLDQMNGRMTFRMLSSAASTAATGGGAAKKLPAIKGRAIWSHGADEIEVQTPFINDKFLKAELEVIKTEFKQGKRQNFGELLSIGKPVFKKKSTAFDPK